MIFEIIDVVLCYMLPCIIVVVLNLLIASKVESSEKAFSKTQKAAASAINSPITIIENRSNSSSKNSIITNGEVNNLTIIFVQKIVYFRLFHKFVIYQKEFDQNDVF